MADYNLEQRRVIGLMLARLQVGRTVDVARAEVERVLDGVSAANLDAGVKAAKEFYKVANRIRRISSNPKAIAAHPQEWTFREFFDSQPDENQVISARVYYTAKDQNGVLINGSVVVNFPAGTKVSTVLARTASAVCGGFVTTLPNQSGSKCTGISTSIQSVATYERARAFTLDVAPIIKGHPNPYPLGGN